MSNLISFKANQFKAYTQYWYTMIWIKIPCCFITTIITMISCKKESWISLTYLHGYEYEVHQISNSTEAQRAELQQPWKDTQYLMSTTTGLSATHCLCTLFSIGLYEVHMYCWAIQSSTLPCSPMKRVCLIAAGFLVKEITQAFAGKIRKSE